MLYQRIGATESLNLSMDSHKTLKDEKMVNAHLGIIAFTKRPGTCPTNLNTLILRYLRYEVGLYTMYLRGR